MGNHEEAKKHFSYLNEPFPEEKTIPSKISPAITSADRWFKFHISKPTALASLLKQGFDIQKIREMGIKPSLLFLFLNEQALFQLKSKGAVEGAIEILNQAIQLGNAPFYIFYNQGMLHYNQGNLQEARLYASLSIQQKDDFLDAHDLMGNVYFREGRYHEALSEFDKVVKISDTDPQGHYNLGCVCWALNEGDRAEEEWEKALLFESQKDSREKQGKFIVEGLNVSVLVQRKSVACRAHISLGSLYEKKGLMEDARREYEQAVEIAPTDPEAYFDLGRLHFERQSKERAIFYLQKHIDLGGHNQEKAKEMLKILKEQGY